MKSNLHLFEKLNENYLKDIESQKIKVIDFRLSTKVKKLGIKLPSILEKENLVVSQSNEKPPKSKSITKDIIQINSTLSNKDIFNCPKFTQMVLNMSKQVMNKRIQNCDTILPIALEKVMYSTRYSKEILNQMPKEEFNKLCITFGIGVDVDEVTK